MTAHNKLVRRLAVAGTAVVATLLLAGCANPVEQMLASAGQSAADKIVSEMSGTEVEGLGSSEIPDDFPSVVPLPDATPNTAMASTVDGERSWIIHYQEGIDKASFDTLVTQLSANGFTEESNADIGGAMRIAVFNNADYMVNVSLLGSDDQDRILQLMVTTNVN